MKNAKIFKTSMFIFILLFTMIGVNALTTITGFSKVDGYTTSNTSRTINYTSLSLKDNADYSYILSDNREFYRNLTFRQTLHTNITGSYYVSNDASWESNTRFLYKYNMTNGNIINATTALATGSMNNLEYSSSNYDLLNTKPTYFIYASSYVTNTGASLFDFASTTKICDISTYYAGTNSRIIGYDTNYIYYLDKQTGKIFNIFDYSCNRIYHLTTFNDTMELTVAQVQNFDDIMINRDTNYFYSLIETTTSNFALVSFDNTGYRQDYIDLNTSCNKTVNMHTQSGQRIVYDFTNMYAYLLFYSDNVSDLYLAQIKLESSGNIGNCSVIGVNDYINDPGFDEYSYKTTSVYSNIFDINNTIYFQVYDTVSSVYDLFSITSGTTDEYTGLSCNSNHSYCVDETSLCLPSGYLIGYPDPANYLCQNVTVLNDALQLRCNIDSLNYCVGGCTNTNYTNPYGISYIHGVCVNTSSTCVNDCYLEGIREAVTGTSYRQCGFYDSDDCLDFSNPISCAAGEYFINQACDTIGDPSTYFTTASFSVYSDIAKATSYSFTSNPPFVNIQNDANLYTLGFYYTANPTSYYMDVNCNYNESLIYENTLTTLINTTSTQTFVGYNNGLTVLRTKPGYNTSLTVVGKDYSDQNIYNYTISHDHNLSSVCLYSYNLTLLGCQDTPSYSNIDYVETTIQTVTDASNNYYSSVKVYIKNLDGGNYGYIYTGFKSSLTGSTSTYAKVKIDTINTTYYSLKIYNGEGNAPSWDNTTSGTYTDSDGDVFYSEYCSYTSVGCRTTRHYYATSTTQGYWNYKDFKVCIDKLGQTSVAVSTSEFGNDWTGSKKLFTAVISLLVIFILFFSIGMYYDLQKVMTWIGVFLTVIGACYFAYIGWIPGWIVLVAGIIASMGIVLFFRNQVIGSSGGN